MGIIVAILCLGFLEVLWRHRGLIPTIVDDPSLWSCYRRKVEKSDLNTVVLLGASRMQLGFSTQTFNEMFPKHRIFQLSIGGEQPLHTFKDLAENENYKGIIICAIIESAFNEDNWNKKQEYVNYYHNQYNLNNMINRAIATYIQSHIVLINPRLNIKDVAIRFFKSKELPNPWYLITLNDRSILADYSMLDIDSHRTMRINRRRDFYRTMVQQTPEEWLKQAVIIETYVNKIQNRGGRVVFVRFPTSDEHLELDEKYFPKKYYWDRFSKVISATTVHFQDIPEMRNFHCPDTSHLDKRDAPLFTKALLNDLSKQGIFNSLAYRK